MKRRILSLFLILCLTLSLAACGKKEPVADGSITIADVNAAVEEVFRQDALSAKMDVELGMSIGPIPMSIPVKAEIKKDGDRSYTKASLSLLGQEVGAEVYTEGEWSYTVTGNQKYKLRTNLNEYDYADDLANMIQALPEGMVEKVSAVANADGSETLTACIPTEKVHELFGEYAEGLEVTTGLGGASLTFKEATIVATLKDGNLSAYTLDIKVTASLNEVDTDLKVKATANFDAPGTAVVITPPEGYQTFKEI